MSAETGRVMPIQSGEKIDVSIELTINMSKINRLVQGITAQMNQDFIERGLTCAWGHADLI